MSSIYQDMVDARTSGRKLLALLIDPDKTGLEQLSSLCDKIANSPATHVFVGGSSGKTSHLDDMVRILKKKLDLSIVLFPGNPKQISPEADGILFLSLISGRNPDFLIGYQVDAVPLLKNSGLEIIPTGYILIESGGETAVTKVSLTTPLNRNNPNYVVQTAQAGEMLGLKLIYLEAGSGAQMAVPTALIEMVSRQLNVPLIVGGGIRTRREIELAYEAGADLVVIGTAFENDPDFFAQNND